MESAWPSELLVSTCQAKWRNTPGDRDLHLYKHLKFIRGLISDAIRNSDYMV